MGLLYFIVVLYWYITVYFTLKILQRQRFATKQDLPPASQDTLQDKRPIVG